jgi:hypothetical protein
MSHDPTQSLRRSGIVLLLQLRVQEEEEEESETSHAAQAHHFGSRAKVHLRQLPVQI